MQTKDTYIIVLENNQGCELDCRSVMDESNIKAAVQDIVLNCELAVGDVIRILDNTEGRS